MKKSIYLLLSIFLIGISSVFSQDREPRDPRGATVDPRGLRATRLELPDPRGPAVYPRSAPP